MSTSAQVLDQGRLVLRLLGGFELVVDREPVALPVNTQRVLGFLAVRRSSAHRDALAGNLWPWTSQDRARANLRTALWRIRKVHSDLVVSTHDAVRLHEELEVDVHVTVERARELLDGDSSEAGRSLSPGLFETDLLPYWDEDWVRLERERIRQLRIHALEAVCRRLTALGKFASAIEAAYAAIAAEPLRESARRVLIEAHLAEGNPMEAYLQLSRYRQLLGEEYGLAPSPDLEKLVASAVY